MTRRRVLVVAVVVGVVLVVAGVGPVSAQSAPTDVGQLADTSGVAFAGGVFLAGYSVGLVVGLLGRILE